ncbi:MAG: alpha/beta hydrolase [Pseudomonadota bacterium]
MGKSVIHTVATAQLNIAYAEHGDTDGWPCILSHGFPYDIHCYDECIEPLVAAGARVITPYLRGYGPTRFLDSQTPRSGEQAALGHDLLQFMYAMGIEKAVLGGFDWGGRASCIVAALWPARVTALVSGNSYNIQDIANSMQPAPAEEEASYWYQYYFHAERGRAGLQQNRRQIARLLWSMWSPTWPFTDQMFEQTAPSFDNPDFVDVVIHSYRHRFALVDGDSAVLAIEQQLQAQPEITVATIAIDGEDNGVSPQTAHHAAKFTGPYEYRVFGNTGHNLPQEQPAAWAQAMLDARALAGANS